MDIKERVRRLLALADETRNNSIEEAASAAAVAQKLMAEHKLSMAEVAVAEGVADDPVTEADAHAATGGTARRIPAWRSLLLAGIAGANFCETILVSACDRKRGELLVIGKQSDIDGVLYLFEYLVREIDRLAHEEAAKTFDPGEHGKRRWMNAFRCGAASEVGERLNDERQRFEQSLKPQSVALVRRADANVRRFMEQKYPRLRSSTFSVSDPSGYSAGRTAGSTIGLPGNSKAIGAPRPQLRG